MNMQYKGIDTHGWDDEAIRIERETGNISEPGSQWYAKLVSQKDSKGTVVPYVYVSYINLSGGETWACLIPAGVFAKMSEMIYPHSHRLEDRAKLQDMAENEAKHQAMKVTGGMALSLNAEALIKLGAACALDLIETAN